jgi:urea transport system permease protein
MTTFFSQLFAGLSTGSILLIIALGLTFTFGQMGVINMAQGEFIMVGAYTGYVLQETLGMTAGLSFWVSLIGLLLEWALIRRLYGRPLDTLLVTWGVSLMLQQLARDVFGAANVQVKAPSFLSGSIDLGGVSLSYTRLFIIGLVLTCVFMIWVFMSKTVHGTRMRAVVQNRPLAEASGVSTPPVDRTTFFIGSGLAGVAGVAICLLGSVGPTLGTAYIVNAFLVVIVGGLGSLKGAVIAAFSIGIFNSYTEYLTDTSLASVAVFVAIIIFLQFKPQGIVVQRTRALA